MAWRHRIRRWWLRRQALYPELIDAAYVIRERGHCKRALENRAGQVCIAGSINVAVSGNARSHAMGWPIGLWSAVVAASNADPVGWNNAPETTEQDVIAALERGAFGLAAP